MSLCLLSKSPGHPAWWVCSLLATLVASAAGSRAEMTISAGWMRNGKVCLSMWACCYAVCCPWGCKYLDEMTLIRGIFTDICTYLPFGHDWAETQGKADFLHKNMPWQVGSWCCMPLPCLPKVLEQAREPVIMMNNLARFRKKTISDNNKNK